MKMGARGVHFGEKFWLLIVIYQLKSLLFFHPDYSPLRHQADRKQTFQVKAFFFFWAYA
jgi:hypothetical protein